MTNRSAGCRPATGRIRLAACFTELFKSVWTQKSISKKVFETRPFNRLPALDAHPGSQRRRIVVRTASLQLDETGWQPVLRGIRESKKGALPYLVSVEPVNRTNSRQSTTRWAGRSRRRWRSAPGRVLDRPRTCRYLPSPRALACSCRSIRPVLRR